MTDRPATSQRWRIRVRGRQRPDLDAALVAQALVITLQETPAADVPEGQRLPKATGPALPGR